MAKRRHSKAALIREELAQSPDATAAEIVKALSAKRVKVTPAHVYNVKATSGMRIVEVAAPQVADAGSCIAGGVLQLARPGSVFQFAQGCPRRLTRAIQPGPERIVIGK